MHRLIALAASAAVLSSSPAPAQKQAPNSRTYDVSVTADGTVYTGTMDLAVAGGKVTGDMHITVPSEITGKPAGTVKGSEMTLDYVYRMTDRNCEGTIVMTLKTSAKIGAGPLTGTAQIGECGRDGDKIPATVELKPKAAAAAKKKQAPRSRP